MNKIMMNKIMYGDEKEENSNVSLGGSLRKMGKLCCFNLDSKRRSQVLEVTALVSPYWELCNGLASNSGSATW